MKIPESDVQLTIKFFQDRGFFQDLNSPYAVLSARYEARLYVLVQRLASDESQCRETRDDARKVLRTFQNWIQCGGEREVTLAELLLPDPEDSPEDIAAESRYTDYALEQLRKVYPAKAASNA